MQPGTARVALSSELTRAMERLASPSVEERESAMTDLRNRGIFTDKEILAMLSSCETAEQRARLLLIHRERFTTSPRGAIGITMDLQGETIRIASVSRRFPAFINGSLLPHDELVAVNGIALQGPDMTRDEALARLRREVFSLSPGIRVEFVINRPNLEPVDRGDGIDDRVNDRNGDGSFDALEAGLPMELPEGTPTTQQKVVVALGSASALAFTPTQMQGEVERAWIYALHRTGLGGMPRLTPEDGRDSVALEQENAPGLHRGGVAVRFSDLFQSINRGGQISPMRSNVDVLRASQLPKMRRAAQVEMNVKGEVIKPVQAGSLNPIERMGDGGRQDITAATGEVVLRRLDGLVREAARLRASRAGTDDLSIRAALDARLEGIAGEIAALRKQLAESNR